MDFSTYPLHDIFPDVLNQVLGDTDPSSLLQNHVSRFNQCQM